MEFDVRSDDEPAGRRKLPVFRASNSAPAATELTGTKANTEASGPKAPPVSHAAAGRAVLTAIEPLLARSWRLRVSCASNSDVRFHSLSSKPVQIVMAILP